MYQFLEVICRSLLLLSMIQSRNVCNSHHHHCIAVYVHKVVGVVMHPRVS